MRPVVVIPRSPTITMFSSAKVSFTAVTAERSRTPLSRQQLPILIRQGPELDQLTTSTSVGSMPGNHYRTRP